MMKTLRIIAVAKKIRIMFMLGAGGLATATNFVRLRLLLTPGSFDDLTYNFAKFNLLGWVFTPLVSGFLHESM